MPVYLSLLPIVLGVSLASLDGDAFSFFAFLFAMLSNIFYQLRAVFAKKLMPVNAHKLQKADVKTETGVSSLSPANVFRLLTLFAAAFSIPFCLLLEGTKILPTWNSAIERGVPFSTLILNLVVSSVSYYAYNEVSFWVLGCVHPITHSISNCLKRVVVILLSSAFLGARQSLLGILGCLLAVSGTVLYAVLVHSSQKCLNSPDHAL